MFLDVWPVEGGLRVLYVEVFASPRGVVVDVMGEVNLNGAVVVKSFGCV